MGTNAHNLSNYSGKKLPECLQWSFVMGEKVVNLATIMVLAAEVNLWGRLGRHFRSSSKTRWLKEACRISNGLRNRNLISGRWQGRRTQKQEALVWQDAEETSRYFRSEGMVCLVPEVQGSKRKWNKAGTGLKISNLILPCSQHHSQILWEIVASFKVF